MTKDHKVLQEKYRELERLLQEAREEAGYYKKIAEETGRRRLREVDELSRLITERKQAESALIKEHNFISAVLSVAGALVVVLDRKGRIVRFNKACEQLTGYTFEEIRGRRVRDSLLLPDELDTVKAVFADLLSGPFPSDHENHWVTKDGSRRLIRWSNTSLLDDRGAVEYVIGTGIDI